MSEFIILSIVVELENCHERLGRYLNRSELAHLFLAFLLLFKQFLLTCYISAVAFCKYILAECFDGLSCNYFSAYSCLYRYFKELAGDIFLKLFGDLARSSVCLFLMHDE